MMDRVDTLVVAPTARGGARRLIEAAVRRGMRVSTPDGTVPGARHHYYGGPLFAGRVVAGLGVGLLEPPDSWLPGLPEAFTRRRVRTTTLAEARRSTRPAFVKPPSSKDFPARVYADGAELAAASADLPPGTAALVADVVEFAAEFRLHVLDGQVRTGSRYATWGHLDPAPLEVHPAGGRVRGFAAELLAACGDSLPSAVVVDVGLTGPPAAPDRDVAVVEANMAWFAQTYRADADRALDVVLRAAGPLAEVRDADRRFLR